MSYFAKLTEDLTRYFKQFDSIGLRKA